MALLLATSCNHNEKPDIERVAVVAFENLTADSSLDWLGTAVPHLIAEQAAGARASFVFPSSTPRQAVTFRATRTLSGYYRSHNSGIDLHLVLQDVPRNRIVDEWRLTSNPPDALDLSNQVASALSVNVRSFGTGNVSAVREYSRGLVAEDPNEREAAYRRALDTDPRFPEAKLALAQLLAARGQPDEARKWLESRADWDPILKIRTEVLLANMDRNTKELVAALQGYANLVPADAGVAEQTAQSLLRLHRYSEAAEWYRKAAVADLQRPDYWNSRAYPLAYSGDFEGAVESLRRYQEADPESPNTLDSLGEVHFRFGRFEDAERFFLDTYDRDPDFLGGVALVKAARSCLFRGDMARAQEIFDRYARTRRDLKDVGIVLYEARWLFWTGRRSEAVDAALQLGDSADATAPLRIEARLQLAAWRLLTGDNAAARESVRQAAQLAGGRLAGNEALLVSFLASNPENPDEWEEYSNKVFPAEQDALRRQALAYANLLAKRFPEALKLLTGLFEQAAPLSRDSLQILLAWTHLETGDAQQAAALLEPNPLIQPRAEPMLHALTVPNLFYLRGRAAAEQGRTDARGNFLLFQRLSGNLPLRFGYEEDAARRGT